MAIRKGLNMLSNIEKMELLDTISSRLTEIQTDLINIVSDVHHLEKQIIEENSIMRSGEDEP